MAENTKAFEHEDNPGTASSTTTWCIFGVGLALILAVQAGTLFSVLHGSNDMREILSRAQRNATELERSIGYGGLIHQFKNYVLRPNEDNYRIAALANANRAEELLYDLQRIAKSLNIETVSLAYTFDMVRAYTERLDQVKLLSADGYAPRDIDQQVRFDDNLALQEVAEVIDSLSTAIAGNIAKVYHRGMLTSLMGTIVTAILGLALTVIIVNRQQRYARTITTIAERLNYSNERLTKANTSLNMFAGIVSHDLKTPIRSISIYSHMIADDIEDAPIVRQHIGGVQKSIDEIIQIVDSLLEFTKVGFSPPQLEALDIKLLFDRLEKGYELEIDGNSSALVFDADLERPVLADPEQLSRVLFHLIENGQKFARKDNLTQIRVQAYTEGEFAIIAVTDNGIGINARNAERIFEPLKCLHGAGSEYEGTGIGLSLVRSIVEAHDGKAWLDTDCHAETRFMISIPLAPQTDVASEC